MRYLSCLLIFVCTPLFADDMTSTPEEFQEFTSLMSGRFRSEIKLIHDWPGNEKKRGDVIHGMRFMRKVADGAAMTVTDAAGTGIVKELTAYNAATKQIETMAVDGGGTMVYIVTWKESPDKWHWTMNGSLKDGQKIKGKGYWEFRDHGKEVHRIGDDFLIGGKPADKLHDKFIRAQ